MKLLIIGGVAGGASAAARYRRLDKDAQITIIDKGDFISFANCGLPYYIGNIVDDQKQLLAATPESMKESYNIDVKIRNLATEIDVKNKKVTVTDMDTKDTREEDYDKLIIATGSSPVKPPIPGIDGKNIFTVWTIPDAESIKDHIKKNSVKKAVIVGGGFIGIEMAENLKHLGLEVSIIEMSDQVMAPLDREMADLIHDHLKDQNIELVLGDGVKAFENDDKNTTVVTQGGKRIEAELVILSIGVKPNSKLAADAGIEVGERGGIKVSDKMETSAQDVYAVGDVIEVVDYVNKTNTMIPLAGPANKQGRIVANTIAGIDDFYSGTQGTSVVKVFDLVACATGSNEKTLSKFDMIKGSDYETITIETQNHADYYPNAEKMTIKILFNLPEGRLLGAQVIGGQGSDKRIDILSTVIRYNGAVSDLKHLEFAYAPPFSSSKDPINILGYLGEKFF
ncbi:FAD-dependent oxidoreductase [Alkalibacter mobilis]|uniref:FAD-dependent oxidoreductase n=1 Tax=Alkalibacter mobilis TaxID=2787712 RepID=UPI00189DBEFE|nr:FAD-dependent oxidoreductase [Alkalibacter mobilis]MBF7096685.1 FAD-dependent oxidoreductase [Alkalibacter mobilis]